MRVLVTSRQLAEWVREGLVERARQAQDQHDRLELGGSTDLMQVGAATEVPPGMRIELSNGQSFRILVEEQTDSSTGRSLFRSKD